MNDPIPGSKKRRLHGSCDQCRTKKIRCDSAQRPGNKCSNCIASDIPCTHLAALTRKNRGLPSNASILSWDTETIIDDLHVYVDEILSETTPYVPPRDDKVIRALLKEFALHTRRLEAALKAAERRSTSATPSTSTSGPSHSSTFGDPAHPIEEPLKRLQLTGERFGAVEHAKSLTTTLQLKEELGVNHKPVVRRPEFWFPHDNPLYYLPVTPSNILLFPPPDLLVGLIGLFFRTTNPHFRLIHEPTFLRQINSGLHYSSHSFGSVVLAACALGARYSDDPRVGEGHYRGWTYYSQLEPVRAGQYILQEDILWHIQLFPLMTLYAYALAIPHQCWLLTGMGIRLAQSKNVHRLKRKEGVEWTVENEMLKRAWWTLMVLDVYVSTLSAKMRMTNEDEFDADYPLEVDDEYWPGELFADPSNPWTQPPGIQAEVSTWILLLKLLNIFSFAQTTIQSISRSAFWDTIGCSPWGHNVAVELDSALNNWLDSIPDHLRWNPHAPTPGSMVLYSAYYWVQIQIHLPFIRLKSNFSSIAMCATAARSCAHVIQAYDKAFPAIFPLPTAFASVLFSAIVLLLSVKDGTVTGGKDMEDVRKLMDVLGRHEDRWQVAGRYHDMIREIFELLDVPRQDPGESKKRTRADIDTGTWDGFSEEVYLTNGWNEDVWQDFQSYLVGLNIWSGERM